MNAQLLRFFGALGQQTPKRNPYYGMKPGDVPFDYAGDPSAPVERPSSWSMFVNPQLADDYSRAMNAPLFSDIAEAQEAKNFPAQLGRRGQELQQTSDINYTNIPRFAEQQFGIEQQQFPVKQAQELDTSGKLLRQRQSIGQEMWGAEDARALAQQKAAEEQRFALQQGQRPQAAAQERELTRLATQSGSDTHKALWKANVYDKNPALQQIPFDAAYAQFGASQQVDWTNVNPNTTAGTLATEGWPQKIGQAQAELARQTYEKIRARGILGTPLTEATGEDIAAQLAMHRGDVDLSLLPADTANRIAQQNLTGRSLANSQFMQENIVPPAQQYQAGMASNALKNLPLTQQAADFTALGDVAKARYPYSIPGQHPTMFEVGETGIRGFKDPWYTSPFLQQRQDSMALAQSMSGGGSGVGNVVGQAASAPRKQGATIPITGPSGQPTLGRKTVSQVVNHDPNGKPIEQQANTPAPNPVRQAVGADIVNPVSQSTAVVGRQFRAQQIERALANANTGPGTYMTADEYNQLRAEYQRLISQ